ncbi:hypothetical protein R3P38DRAFT_3048711 [Favolaschia claudopus]|uniref:F-box domain-containing protein n=1 Tax=Favolaschia claudopus TaxID=2862362 RepID=A0AAW0A644_9AGAR
MHRGLRIPEVVELICAAAEPSALAVLSRTCQTFQTPALAVLWATQKQLTNLLKCLPSDVWEEVQNHPGHVHSPIVFRLRRPIASSDLSRVLFYAEKVKNLFIEPPHRLSWIVYEALSLALSVHPLLPNLRHLTWLPPDHVYSHIRMLVGQKLQSITFDVERSRSVGLYLLPYLNVFHPDLSSVEIGPMDLVQSLELKESVYSTIRSMNRLQELKIPDLDIPTTLHLAQLPHLRRLNVGTFHQLFDDLQPELAAMGPAFSALRQFIVYSESPPSVIGFLDVVSPDALSEITVNFGSASSMESEQWRILNTSIARRSFRTLKCVELRERFVFEQDMNDNPAAMISKDSFYPLLICRNLTDVALQTGYGIDIDNDFINKIAEAWPQLETLSLSPKFQASVYIPQVTLAGLIPLAQNCRCLTSLTLVLNATVLDIHPRERPGNGISNEALVKLDVVESPISSPAAVASFLSAIFPELQQVLSREDEERNTLAPHWEEDVEKWDMVGDLVQFFASTRAQENHNPAPAAQ